MSDLFDIPLQFTVIPAGTSASSSHQGLAVLTGDRWDDWGKYCTQFYLTLVDKKGENHEIGNVKIGQFGLREHSGGFELPEGHRKPDIPTSFPKLDDRFFSIGQEASYYENLNALGEEVRRNVLESLHDVAADEDLWNRAKDEAVMGESLLRSLSTTEVEWQFRRMTRGLARLTTYSFSFIPPPLEHGSSPPTLHFHVIPQAKPPRNVHVLIGRNGVGKTRLLNSLLQSLVAPGEVEGPEGTFKWERVPFFEQSAEFANVVYVSFSAFDSVALFPERLNQATGLRYAYVGLRDVTNNPRAGEEADRKTLKTYSELTKEFAESVSVCAVGDRRRRWLEAVSFLENDMGLSAINLPRLMDYFASADERKEAASETFRILSSGHKLVLLTITRLVETVEEKTLALIDEPEAHLHPPLLSALVRALSNLLSDRNGVAIVATHSPVVLQEVPKECVLKLIKVGGETKAEQPPRETFGENVGVLTHETFGLELVNTGFYSLLREAAKKEPDLKTAIQSFNEALGDEAKAVLRALYLEKGSRNQTAP